MNQRLCLVPDRITEAHPLAVTTKDAARLVHLDRTNFLNLVKKGQIKAKVRGDRGLIFLVSDLQEYLESLPNYKPGDSILPRHLRNERKTG